MVRRKANRVNRGLSTGARRFWRHSGTLVPDGCPPGRGLRRPHRRVARRGRPWRFGLDARAATFEAARASTTLGRPIALPLTALPGCPRLAPGVSAGLRLPCRPGSGASACATRAGGTGPAGWVFQAAGGRRGRRERRGDRGRAGEGRRCPGGERDADRGADRVSPLEGDVQVVGADREHVVGRPRHLDVVPLPGHDRRDARRDVLAVRARRPLGVEQVPARRRRRSPAG